MLEESLQNKRAWEYKVYEWRIKHQGSPSDVAKEIKKSPSDFLRFHANFFNDVKNLKIANICGSDGRRAVALALLGAQTTIFDISEPQKQYALELADAAGVSINYELGDFNLIDVYRFREYFNKLYCEGGILHYFHNLDLFFRNCYKILSKNGVFILSDFHPFQKSISVERPIRNVEMTHGDYFNNKIHEGHVPYAKYFPQEMQNCFPTCKLKFYTLSDIINNAIKENFIIEGFYEHPKYNNDKVPGEFTLVLRKEK